MDISEWGPAGWKFLHSITFAQPSVPNNEQKHHIKQFFTSLGYLLPCKKCSKHYREYLQSHPIPLDSRLSLTKWLVDVHNNANEENRQNLPFKLPRYTYQDAVDEYAYDDEEDIIDNPKNLNKNSIIKKVAVTIIVLFLIVITSICISFIVYSCTGNRSCPLNSS